MSSVKSNARAWAGKQWRTVTARGYAALKDEALDALRKVTPKGVKITQEKWDNAVRNVEQFMGINPNDPTGSWNWRAGQNPITSGSLTGRYGKVDPNSYSGRLSNWLGQGDLTGRTTGKYEGRQRPIKSTPTNWDPPYDKALELINEALNPRPPLERVPKPGVKRPRAPETPVKKPGPYWEPRAPPEPMDVDVINRVLANVPLEKLVTGPVRLYRGKYRLPPYASYVKQYTKRARRS